jgi:hypothetical protein
MGKDEEGSDRRLDGLNNPSNTMTRFGCAINRNNSLFDILLFTSLHVSAFSDVKDRLCGLVVRVLGYRSGGPSSIPGTIKKVVGLERGPLSLVSTTEELLDRKVAAPV